ncbi:uncharacterized protein MYCFIDRAFT_177494 [Pseudocercospora fijiensis CIRAD86]|uniref:Uncharacterized protein n=1 Tax=Pseudocercospora fijiensis (strain CIRAD86) TaxID=383855 RepID=M3AST1_PSEFD|nr:uncharacterized protein MYCFIDRAFT_177494 [Pseudocercospora fijiensis CIRAD86]EME80552.1 hypothetical protein MYCFIDRAFT_177494 [Pseudocercospora fijiensis CIRAD86]
MTVYIEEKLARAWEGIEVKRGFEPTVEQLADVIMEVLGGVGDDKCVVRTVNLCVTHPEASPGSSDQTQLLDSGSDDRATIFRGHWLNFTFPLDEKRSYRISVEITVQDTTTLHSSKISKELNTQSAD